MTVNSMRVDKWVCPLSHAMRAWPWRLRLYQPNGWPLEEEAWRTWRETAANKGTGGLAVPSFWTIPGKRIPLPGDPQAAPAGRHLCFPLFKGEGELSPLLSAVQTRIKNNTFLPPFICLSGPCSYFWAMLVADWNLLPLFLHSFVSEGIRDVYGGGWTQQGQVYAIDTSRWLKRSQALNHFSALSHFWPTLSESSCHK